MRIAHVVTYVSPDAAYGGPVTVAINQARELVSRGHEVTVFASSPISRPSRRIEDGVDIRLYPARRIHRSLGFAGTYSPGLSRAIGRAMREYDVFHIHFARDLVVLPVANRVRRARRPFVLQPHGMIDRSDHPLAWPVDTWGVRPAVKAAGAVLCLTESEERQIRDVASAARVQQIVNGVSRVVEPTPVAARPPQVLFLARLHERKRPLAFVDMARELMQRGVEATFIIAGPDEGEAHSVQARISEIGDPRLTYIGPVDAAGARSLFSESRVFVLPSVGEVFPMAVLEAFQAGVPVVTTSSIGIARLCNKYGAAVLTDGSPEQLAARVEELLENAELASQIREAALNLIAAELSMDQVASELEGHYRAAISR